MSRRQRVFRRRRKRRGKKQKGGFTGLANLISKASGSKHRFTNPIYNRQKGGFFNMLWDFDVV